MSLQSLDPFFRPKRVVLIGATARPNSVGSVLARNLAAFGQDRVAFVNPFVSEIDGVAVHPSVADLAAPADLAVVAVPPEAIVGVMEEIGAAGIRRAAEQEGAFVGIVQIGFDGVKAHEWGKRDGVGAIPLKRFNCILFGGAADVAAFGVQYDGGIRRNKANGGDEFFQRAFGTLRGEIGNLRFVGAGNVGGGFDDFHAEVQQPETGGSTSSTSQRARIASSVRGALRSFLMPRSFAREFTAHFVRPKSSASAAARRWCRRRAPA